MWSELPQHWSVENELHWVLDVTFREDAISLKDPDGAAQVALFNRIALKKPFIVPTKLFKLL